MLPKVTVFSFGGTIAATGASGEGVTPRLGAGEPAAAVPDLNCAADLETVTFRARTARRVLAAGADIADAAAPGRRRAGTHHRGRYG